MKTSLFFPTGSYFERIHPGTKIFAMILAFIPPFFSAAPWDILPYLALLFLSIFLAGAWPNLRRIGVLMGLLFVMSLVLWTILQKGTIPLAKVGSFTIFEEGALHGFTVGLRLNSFILVALIFLTSTRIEDLNYGLSRLGLPFVVGFALSLAFRLTPLFVETGQSIATAQKIRGLNLDSGGLIQRMRRYVPIIVPMLVSGLRRSDQLAMALESKGFGISGTRTVLLEYGFGWRDYLLIGVLLSVCTLMGIHYFYRISG